MDPVEEIRELVAYDQKVYRRFLAALAELPRPTLSKELGSGHGSLVRTMAHILEVREVWLALIAQGRQEELEHRTPPSDSIHGLRELRSYSNKVWRQTEALLEGLSRRSLERRLDCPWMPGFYDLRDAFYQVSYEQAHHLGEVIALLWQMDREPPEMVWIRNRPRRVGKPG